MNVLFGKNNIAILEHKYVIIVFHCSIIGTEMDNEQINVFCFIPRTNQLILHFMTNEVTNYIYTSQTSNIKC